MVNKEEILRFVKSKGPVIPNQIKKEFGGETYLISAILSEMTSEGKIKVSHTKIGSSPTYYTSEQTYKLQDLKKYLNHKDQQTMELLKERKILRDRSQEMLVRVGLRNIKDFAKALEVNVRGEKEIFWKWYLTPRDEAEGLIRKEFVSLAPIKEEPKPELEKEEVKEEKREVKTEEKQESLEKEEPKKNSDTSKEGFMKQIYDYFEEKNITIIEEEVIRKNSEIEFQIEIPSNVGKMEYFCKAKSKKKCNDGDLSSAYIKGQTLKLPVIFITTGDVTKKALEMLKKEFKGMVIKQI